MLQFFKPLLARPSVYLLFSRLIGGANVYRVLARDHLRPRAGDKLLDIGCGPARVLYFLDGVDYTGFDLSPEYIAMAQKLHGARGRFFCRKVIRDAWAGRAQFDLALASGVLHHLDDEEVLELFELTRSVLKPDGRLVTLDGCYVEGQSRLARRYLLSRDRGQFVRTRRGYEKLTSRVFPNTQDGHPE